MGSENALALTLVGKAVRGLSLTRPWPFAFVNGPLHTQKRIENRSWKPPYSLIGCLVALHAAKSWSAVDREFISDMLECDVPGKKESPHSEIFAVTRLAGYTDRESRVEPFQQQWFFGPFGWQFDHFVPLVEPVKCTGALGLWTFEDKQKEFESLCEVYGRSVVLLDRIAQDSAIIPERQFKFPSDVVPLPKRRIVL